jgi:hypothetical protein
MTYLQRQLAAVSILVHFSLLLVSSSLVAAAEAAPVLTVNRANAFLYAHADRESAILAMLESGENLRPLAQAIGTSSWYVVISSKGYVGWVQSADVNANTKANEIFRDSSKISPRQQFGSSLAQCLARADDAHQTVWRQTCERAGKPHDCSLSSADADVLKRDHRAARAECIRLYEITGNNPTTTK